MSDIERIRSRLSELQIEIQELETAERVLSRLLPERRDGHPAAVRGGRKKKPDARPTIMELAKVILKERGEMHYSLVADEAIKRGYKGKEGSTIQKMRQSFWSILNRNKDIFTGKDGKFTLK